MVWGHSRLMEQPLKGFWSISISGNWRLVFRFDDRDAHDINLVDDH